MIFTCNFYYTTTELNFICGWFRIDHTLTYMGGFMALSGVDEYTSDCTSEQREKKWDDLSSVGMLGFGVSCITLYEVFKRVPIHLNLDIYIFFVGLPFGPFCFGATLPYFYYLVWGGKK